MKTIKSENLIFEYKRYDQEKNETTKIRALDNISLEIEKGDFVAVLGHNGSGKSTLAKHINVILKPTEGAVFVNGMDTRDESLIWNIRQNAGMVFQNPDNQIIATIVEEDIAFGPENLGIAPSEIRRRVDESLSMVNMGEFKKSTPSYLSGGQKQRIAIAGILAMRPSIIVLDEPTAMLDPIGRKEVINTVMRLNKEEGITIVLITHFMEEAVKANRVVVINEGQIAMDGTPKGIFRREDELRNLGLDIPQVTELSHALREKGLNIEDDIITIDEMADKLCQLKSGI
ncbi:energy-coupling factor transporter ATPase [Anaeropeptidivorans aminofermentans]|uniref:energy-coupling factor transporter ATPase n=1 Tax=Anaeropeptidivorans aminofermentans TaxID=2934315 RepID=UPI002025B278|nr:energy-coupling factor transporter ATPase [Anaeropeptidivorans aminofermentans]